MGKGTAFNAPLIIYPGRTTPGMGQSANPDAALSMIYAGTGFMDSRGSYNNGKSGVMGFAATGLMTGVEAVPSTISATAIAAAQVPTAGTALTLASSTANGITVLSATTAFTAMPSGNAIPAGALLIDGLPATIAVGLDGAVQVWDTSTLIQRAVQITSVGNDSSGYFVVSGFDYAGYPVTQKLTGANAGVATTTKTFKGIYSITPGGTLSGANVSVGQADVYGFPFATALWERVFVFWNGALITSSTGFTAADTTSPATQLTGDARGTYAVQSASNGSKRLVMRVTPSVAAITGTSLNNGIWGVPSV